MLRAVKLNSIYSPHFAVWPAKRNVLERAVCHLAACSDNIRDLYLDLLITLIVMVNKVHLKACSLLIAVIIRSMKRKFSDHYFANISLMIASATNTGIDCQAVF